MLSVLVYPNITYARNLEADSFVVVLRGILKHLNRPDIEWTILTPKPIDSLWQFDNIIQVPLPLPTYPNTMRTHFDARHLLRVLNWKHTSYDVVYTHLPEHTLQLRNLFHNATNERPAFVGYSHWIEVPENSMYDVTLMTLNLIGLLSTIETGVNSEWLRSLILDYAEWHLSPTLVELLEEVVQVHYLGREVEPAVKPVKPPERVIVFNHRPNAYTGHSEFVEVVDRIWKDRQDFRVLTTLAEGDRPWLVAADTANREDYRAWLAGAYIGVGNFQRYSAWSMSAMDGFAEGLPYLLPRGFCYPEMLGKADHPFIFDDLETGIRDALDHPRKVAGWRKEARRIADEYAWPNRIGTYQQLLDKAVASITPVGKSERYGEIREFIEHRGSATKEAITEHLGWGKSIAWTPYRAALRRDGYSVTKTTYMLPGAEQGSEVSHSASR